MFKKDEYGAGEKGKKLEWSGAYEKTNYDLDEDKSFKKDEYGVKGQKL